MIKCQPDTRIVPGGYEPWIKQKRWLCSSRPQWHMETDSKQINRSISMIIPRDTGAVEKIGMMPEEVSGDWWARITIYLITKLFLFFNRTSEVFPMSFMPILLPNTKVLRSQGPR